jgi:N-methylhydantoinase A
VPIQPGVLSALGMLLTDIKYTDVVTRLLDTHTASAEAFGEIYAGLEKNLRAELSGEGMDAGAIRFDRTCDMRYRGQAYEINVPVPDAAPDKLVGAMSDAFHAKHRSMYGQAAEGDPVEFVNYRVTGVGVIKKPELKPLADEPAAGSAEKGARQAYFPGIGWAETPRFERSALRPGATIEGPALVEEAGATVVLFPGHVLTVDGFGNMTIKVPGRRSERSVQ